MSIDAQALMDRVAALETEAMAVLSTPVTAEATDHFFYVQGSTPYFVNRLGEIVVEGDSEDFDLYTYDVVMRLIIGQITQGYQGEPENQLQTYIPQIIRYFNERELLQSVTYPTGLDNLHRARVVACSGLQVFRHTGATETLQVGTEWTLRCDFEEMIEQQYL